MSDDDTVTAMLRAVLARLDALQAEHDMQAEWLRQIGNALDTGIAPKSCDDMPSLLQKVYGEVLGANLQLGGVKAWLARADERAAEGTQPEQDRPAQSRAALHAALGISHPEPSEPVEDRIAALYAKIGGAWIHEETLDERLEALEKRLTLLERATISGGSAISLLGRIVALEQQLARLDARVTSVADMATKLGDAWAHKETVHDRLFALEQQARARIQGKDRPLGQAGSYSWPPHEDR